MVCALRLGLLQLGFLLTLASAGILYTFVRGLGRDASSGSEAEPLGN